MKKHEKAQKVKTGFSWCDDADGADLLAGLLKEDFHADFDKIMKFIGDKEGEL